MSNQNSMSSSFNGPIFNATSVAAEFRKSGFAILRNVFDKAFIDLLHTEFVQNYKHHLIPEDKEDALTVGNKRYKTSVELNAPFDSIDLLANSQIMPAVRKIIDDKVVLASVVCVTSLPGAQEQSSHRDHPWLFGTPIDRLLPSYALKMVVPLVPMNPETGTTRVWPESQNNVDAVALDSDSVDPVLDAGDCMFTDYNLMHQGLANKSGYPRPVLFLSYAKHWFRDEQNFQKQEHLVASKSVQRKLSATDPCLFSRVQASDY